MKAIILTILLSLTLPAFADYSQQLKENSKIRRDNAKKIYDLRLEGLKEGYEAQIKFFDEMDALASKMVPGDKENNKKIRQEMKAKRKAFKEESKARRKDFKENKIKPLKLKAKEERKARKKAYKEKMKSQKNSANK
jgi:hypothetical protein